MSIKKEDHMVKGGRAVIARTPVFEHDGREYTTIAFMARACGRRHDLMERSYRIFLNSPGTRPAYLRVSSHALDPQCGLPKGRSEVMVPVSSLPEFFDFAVRKRMITEEKRDRIRQRMREKKDDKIPESTPEPEFLDVSEPSVIPETKPAAGPPPPTPADFDRVAGLKLPTPVTNPGEVWFKTVAAVLHSIADDAVKMQAAYQSGDPMLLHSTISVAGINSLMRENSTLRAQLTTLQEQNNKLLRDAHQAMEAGHVPFEMVEMVEGKVWNSADLRKTGVWYTQQDLYREYCQRGNTATKRLNSREFGRLVYFVFCEKLQNSAGQPVPRISALKDRYVSLLRIRIPNANAQARQRSIVRDAVEKKLPIAPEANWITQLWYSEIGRRHLFDKFAELFHQWERAGFPQHAADRLTRTTPDDVQTETRA